MAWLQVHQTLKDHRKLFDAADQLEVEPPHMMGLLVSFWLWALDNAPTGSLVDITPRMISRAAQWDGDPEKLAKTLIQAGWIDEKEDGTLEIHDWYEYAGKLIDQRQAEKERSRSRRAAAAASADASPDDPTPTAGRPANSRKKAGGRDQSREDKTREGNTPPSPSDEGNDGGTKSLVEARFLEFWKAYPKKTGKQYALKAWNKIKPTAELHERIMQAVDAQKRSDQWRRENGRYIPNPSTWLNGGYGAVDDPKDITTKEYVDAADNALKVKVDALWDFVCTDITSNPFQITFDDLEGLTVSSGIWNTGQRRLEC